MKKEFESNLKAQGFEFSILKRRWYNHNAVPVIEVIVTENPKFLNVMVHQGTSLMIDTIIEKEKFEIFKKLFEL